MRRQWAPSTVLQYALRRLDRGAPGKGRTTPLALDRDLFRPRRRREHMRWLRTAARLAVVAFPRRQHLLHRLGHRQRRIEVLVLDDRRLVDLPDRKSTRLNSSH